MSQLCDWCSELGRRENFEKNGYPAALSIMNARQHVVDNNAGKRFWSNTNVPKRMFSDLERLATKCVLCSRTMSNLMLWVNSQRELGHNVGLDRCSLEFDYHLIPKRDINGYSICQQLYYFEVLLELQTQETYLSLYVWPSPPSERGMVDVSTMLANDKYGPTTLEWPDATPYTARTRPVEADLRLLRKWKTLCTHCHELCYQSLGVPEKDRRRLSFLRVIDVEKKCLVELSNTSDNISWVALSYVWGDREFLALTKDTRGSLLKEDALNPERSNDWTPPLSTTVADAMRVTAAVGERYLWVDCLCIQQDDDDDKGLFLPQMATIYDGAEVTIIQAAGKDAFAGLSGVRPGMRSAAETPFRLPGVAPPGVSQPGEYEWFTHSRTWVGYDDYPCYWSKRAWTLQEELMSRRRLYFTAETVFWECREESWQEDVMREIPPRSELGCGGGDLFTSFLQRKLNPWFDGRQQKIMRSPKFSFLSQYRSLVGSYTARILSYKRDTLFAISAALHGLAHVYPETSYVWGMSTAFFEIILNWAPVSDDNISCNPASHRLSVGGDTIEVDFPSWSWTGWTGVIGIAYSMLFVTANFVFYYFPTLGTTIPSAPMRDGEAGKEELCCIRPSSESSDDWVCRPSWWDDKEMPVTTADLPPKLVQDRGLRYSLLAFRTSRATLHVDTGKPDTPPSEFTLRDVNNRRLAVLAWLQKLHDPTPSGPIDGIIVNVEYKAFAERMNDEDVKDIVTIMLVERRPHGALSRCGLARIYEDDWAAIPDENRKWELVVLI